MTIITRLPQRSLADLITHHAERSPDAIAIITSDSTLTYRTLEQRVEHCAHQLSASGVASGDRIALMVSDELLLLTVLLAAARLGVPVLLLPRSSSDKQRATWMASAGVKQWVSDVAPDAHHSGRSAWIEAKTLMTKTARASKLRQPGQDGHLESAIFVIIAGSGSTGKPKLMPITQGQMWARIQQVCTRLNITSQDRLATMSHLEYVGSVHRLLAALHVGAAFVLLEAQRKEWRQWHQRYGLTVLSATVFHAQQMLNELRASGPSDTRPLDGVQLSVSSSVVTHELRQSILNELCSQLRVNYGTNEAWLVTVADPDDLLQHPGTVGRPLPDVRVQIVDDQLRTLPIGQTGLIAVQSDQVICGYLDDEPATQQAFREGWFIPGDMGYLTADGHLIFCGRCDNMMIFNGINIFPIEIEQCLLSHPDVSDALAMPTRHAMHQDVPVAFVVLREHARVSQHDLQQYASAALGAKQPRFVLTVPEIPRNRMGKPIKEDLIQLLVKAFPQPRTEPMAAAAQQVKIAFIPRALAASQRLAAWTHVLVGEGTSPPAVLPALTTPADEARQWILAVLGLALGLLQTARIPIFDPIKVIHLRPPTDQAQPWIAVCQHPDPALLNLETLLKLIREAFELTEWALEAEIDSPSQREDFYKRIQTGAFNVLASAMPTGKSMFEVLRVAHRLSIPYRPLIGGVFQLGWGCHARLIHRSTTDHDSAIGLHLTGDKLFTAHMLRQAGLPAPLHHKAPSLDQAKSWAQRIGYPVVVKPSDMERGEGVTVDVWEEGLEVAFRSAQQLSRSKTVLIERQVPGVCHRLFISHGQLLYAVKRLPMGVYGDGTSSIRALVQAVHTEQMKRPPWMRSGVPSLLALPLNTLQQQGWAPEDVPPVGHFVALRRIESTAWGGVDEDVSATVHPDNVSAAIRATQLLGLEVAGVDLISTDITQAWHRNGAVFNEVNYAPLLGGGEISRRHIPTYLSRLLRHQGRIPIETLVGEQATWSQGRNRWQRLIEMGLAAYLTNDTQTLNPQGQDHPMSSTTLRERVQALLMDKHVGALVIVDAPKKTPRP